ncbi:PAS domain-containing protein [Chitinophaga sp. SYP-B3965]|uniref:PAS domain-containing sensor histidine kinase n=1 Tax=Chitinophaga sp. SYP-B3965 TaxID=2663120 RepID=UPI001299B81E|nr:ATP-binding protein [Chitinophaga sp. SYP-B3965]MRG47910.1 PAS domain-containing protein [Chitinophaga sp. SYP-B3965]
MTSTPTYASFKFMEGGGELGALIRNYDWASTSIGTPDQWPQSLRTALSIVLNSRFPMFLWWGPDMIQFYNDAYRPSLGIEGKHPAAVGQKGEDCWPEIWHIIKPQIDQVWAGESTWNEDLLVPIYRNGSIEDMYWTFSYSPVKDEEGQVGGILVVCHETTEKRKQGIKIEIAEANYRQLVESLPVAVFTIDANGFINLYNNAARELWGREPAIGKDKWNGSYKMFLTDGTPIAHENGPMAKALRENRDINLEMLIQQPDGKMKHVIAYPEPLHDHEGYVTGAMNVMIDITELKEAEHALRASEELLEKRVHERTAEIKSANFNLQRSNSELEQFAYITSHDLQEPLRKIRTFTEMLESSLGSISSKSKGYLDKIAASSTRMRRLIKDVLHYSRLIAPEETFTRVDLHAVIWQVVDDFELLIREKNAKINIQQLPVIEANPLQINQLFSNLISNALKFNTRDEPAINITVTMLDMDAQLPEGLNPSLSYCLIEFKDNGIGFDQQYAEQIFTIFQRLHTKHEYAGTGIGLALCRKIVLNHHGSITAHSENGEGATFRIILPLKQFQL